MNKNSCYKCEKRYPGCHSDCQTYKKEKQERDKMKEDIRQEKLLNTLGHGYCLGADRFHTSTRSTYKLYRNLK